MTRRTESQNEQRIQSAFRRRQFVKLGVTGAASVAFAALAAKEAGARGAQWPRFSPDYGPLSPVKDLATGLYLLALPKGFRYMSYGWTGQLMDDGRPTPTDHDGMAVVARWGSVISLVRNHELAQGEGSQCLVEGGMYNANEYGGTTNVFFDLHRRKFVKSYTSLGGTIRNCAGGLTPWNSWISCEETFHAWNNRADGFNHGYIFDVPGFGISDGQPIRAAGRFSHEAVAVDPRTGIVYETEDTGQSAFYRYTPPGCSARGHFGRAKSFRQHRGHELLEDGGELHAMVVDGVSRKDLRGSFANGSEFSVTWQKVEDPEGMLGSAFASAPDAAIIARGEGAWYDSGKIYFVSSSGGAAGHGQIWVYEPHCEKLTLLYESPDAASVDGPDNIAISPRGGILLCEDGDNDPQRLVGLTPDGTTFEFALNNIVLADGDIDLIDAAFPGSKSNFWDNPVGDYRGVEWAGATFYDDWLFANIQSPGVTFAITGPWHKGAL
jgi:secreted PhoX family phosphatase